MDNAPFASSPATLVDKPIATVLVVDDTPDNLTLMGSLLREHYLVKVANHGEKALKTLLKKLPAVEFHPIVRSGDARTLVLEEAQSLGADLTVLGTHGKTALKSFLVGSVAEWVLSHATNDVLIVRP